MSRVSKDDIKLANADDRTQQAVEEVRQWQAENPDVQGDHDAEEQGLRQRATGASNKPVAEVCGYKPARGKGAGKYAVRYEGEAGSTAWKSFTALCKMGAEPLVRRFEDARAAANMNANSSRDAAPAKEPNTPKRPADRGRRKSAGGAAAAEAPRAVRRSSRERQPVCRLDMDAISRDSISADAARALTDHSAMVKYVLQVYYRGGRAKGYEVEFADGSQGWLHHDSFKRMGLLSKFPPHWLVANDGLTA
ncbi:hypothetical protein JKP88DRAFT_273359 [Tribonema minus]|uniref:Uncharacterized protein n=1 Tax=Tribonema minus TaxID=303371 RepID=A0A835Z2X4_9STRA|nr:hypothetical protein JKP88DRAFT_273359 [Tribonema minus]